eukprot:IDg11791t1
MTLSQYRQTFPCNCSEIFPRQTRAHAHIQAAVLKAFYLHYSMGCALHPASRSSLVDSRANFGARATAQDILDKLPLANLPPIWENEEVDDKTVVVTMSVCAYAFVFVK